MSKIPTASISIARKIRLDEGFFGSPYEANRSEALLGFSIEKWRPIAPNYYLQVEWAKQVIALWKDGLTKGYIPIYPPDPTNRPRTKAMQAAQSRGGVNRAIAVRRRKREREESAKAREQSTG